MSNELERLVAERAEIAAMIRRMKPNDLLTRMSFVGKLKAIQRKIDQLQDTNAGRLAR